MNIMYCSTTKSNEISDLVECNPHALHSLDPQAGVDIAVYTGMKLARYETMLDIWRQIGNYP